MAIPFNTESLSLSALSEEVDVLVADQQRGAVSLPGVPLRKRLRKIMIMDLFRMVHGTFVSVSRRRDISCHRQSLLDELVRSQGIENANVAPGPAFVVAQSRP